MLYKKATQKKWKSVQISYFKKYLKNFENNSTQYNIIKQGIEKLEK